MKSFLKSTILYSIMAFLPIAARVITLPILLLYLSPKDMGAIGLASTVAVFLPVFFTLGLENGFSYYYFTYNKSKKLLNAYFTSILLTITGAAVFFLVILIFSGEWMYQMIFSDPNYTFEKYGLSTVLLSALSGINSLLLLYYRNQQKPVSYTVISASMFLVSVGVELIGVCYYKSGPETILWLRFFSYLIVSAIAWAALLLKMKFVFDFRFIKYTFSYSIPIMFYIILSLIYMHYDKILVENYLTLELVAVYNLAAVTAFIVENILQALQSATLPDIYQKSKRLMENVEGISRIYRGIGNVILFTIVMLCVFYPFATIHLLSEVYFSSFKVLPLLLIGQILRYFYCVYVEPLFFLKETKKLPLLNLFAAIASIGLNILLIPRMGLVGVGVASVITRAGQLLLAVYYYKRVSEFRYKLRYTHIFMIGIICTLLLIMIFNYWGISTQTQMYIYLIPFVVFSIMSYRVFLRGITLRNTFSKSVFKTIQDRM
ncbi:MAG: oligosaccharide flippase family protein [Bacteroidetes bacterium]|nr:oligosaccharide flippase family protein [Bacteroidota bacterium]